MIRQVALGKQGLHVSSQGFGCMGLTAFYGPRTPDDQAIRLLKRAYDLGVTHFDTAERYAIKDEKTGKMIWNESVLGKALKQMDRNKVTVATKFGPRPEGNSKGETLKKACYDSLERLGLEYVDLYYLHRVDPKTPIEETMKTMKELVKEGKIKYVGLSEASPDHIRRAHAVHPISAVQQEWSLWTRDLEDDIVPVCRELGIGIVAYSPLGRGFLSGAIASTPNDWRNTNPRFQSDALKANQKLLEEVKRIAQSKNVNEAQIALAWLHHQGDDVVPIPGTTKIANLESNVAATRIRLTKEEIEALGKVFARVKGERGTKDYMQMSAYGWQKQAKPKSKL